MGVCTHECVYEDLFFAAVYIMFRFLVSMHVKA
jgi:hypothetical protein